ncbi:MAG: hypothetical protein M3P06_03180 [Acidobacteriota bacterium]|nr:hypothetical protein [Acidobacteriota bacterium]
MYELPSILKTGKSLSLSSMVKPGPTVRPTKRQLVARLVRGPIQVEPVSALAYRIAPYGEPDPNAGVWLALAPAGRTLIVQDYAQVHATINGSDVPLTYRETEAIMARLRRLFARSALPSFRPHTAAPPHPAASADLSP